MPQTFTQQRRLELTGSAACRRSSAGSKACRPEACEKLTWRGRDGFDLSRLTDHPLQWTNLSQYPFARLIKENAKRQVWRIQLGNRFYYAKLYYVKSRGSWLKRRLRGPACVKEWQVARFALQHDIACIKPVAYAVCNDRRCPLDCILITEAVGDAMPLADYWLYLHTDGSRPRRCLLTDLQDNLARLLAAAHHAGMAHADLHPGNLLVQAGRQGRSLRVVFVDLQNVRIRRTVSDKQAMASLAQLNQWFRKHATLTERMRLLKSYVRWRRELNGPGDAGGRFDLKRWAGELDKAAARHASRLWASRDRRVMRHGKYFARLKLPDRWRAHVFLKTKHPMAFSPASYRQFDARQWRRILEDVPAFLDRLYHHGSVIKDSRSTRVYSGRINLHGRDVPVVCKHAIRRKKLAVLWDCWRDSRSLRAWKCSFAMLHRGLAVALPLAALERRIGPYLADSILITEQIQPAINLKTFWINHLGRISPRRRRTAKLVLIRQLADLLRKMHQLNFVHRDLKASNIMIKNPPMELEDRRQLKDVTIVLVDLDGLSLKRRVGTADRLRSLVRLNASAQECPYITRTDRLRFLKSYLTYYGSGKPQWKQLWKGIERLTARRTQTSSLT